MWIFSLGTAFSFQSLNMLNTEVEAAESRGDKSMVLISFHFCFGCFRLESRI